MTKGVSIKFRSYEATVPKLLELIKFERALEKQKTIILKPAVNQKDAMNTPVEFVEEVLKFCLKNKKPDTSVFIAEGSDGAETMELFDSLGYKTLSEKYQVGLLDLNQAEIEEIQDGNFSKFESIRYPKLLLEGFIVSLPKLSHDGELDMQGSLSNMLGAFPSRYYQGLFARKKSKIRKWPLKYAVHDILRCKMPDFTVIDASEQGTILAGFPLDMDKQAAKLVGKEWKDIQYLRFIDENFSQSFQHDGSKEQPTNNSNSRVNIQ
ncbi:DUF362 domain-containing protein [Candidatus Pacearchaeota archaeon]|nr:DUF362 domain-containing protein [Candidatus Pacearchaeota archaeon]